MEIDKNKLIEELKSQIKNSNDELMAALLKEADTVKSGVMIKTEYILKIGKYEIERYNLYFGYVKLRRMIDLYQAAINKQEYISNDDVEEIINNETKEYQSEINCLINDLHTAIKIDQAERVTPEDYKKIKETYRYIVSRIHPDINPNPDQNSKFLWNMTQDAYLNNDLNHLLLLKSLVGNSEITIINENQIEKLEKKHMEIIYHIDQINDRIKRIKSGFPFNKIELLNNEEAIKKFVGKILIDSNSYREYNDDLLLKLKELKLKVSKKDD